MLDNYKNSILHRIITFLFLFLNDFRFCSISQSLYSYRHIKLSRNAIFYQNQYEKFEYQLYEFHCSNLVNIRCFLIVRTKSYNNKNYFVVVDISTSITLLTTILKQE